MGPSGGTQQKDLMIAVLGRLSNSAGGFYPNEHTPNTKYLKSIEVNPDRDNPFTLTFGKTMKVRIKGWAKTTSYGWVQIKCGDAVIVKTSLNTTKNFDTVVEVTEGTTLAITNSYHEQQTWMCDILTV